MPGLLKRGSYMRKYGNHWQFEKKMSEKRVKKERTLYQRVLIRSALNF